MENQEKKIQNMQFLEQNLQNILMQKQAFQLELSETTSALKEIEKSKDCVYKIIGQLMIKKDAKEIKEELINKEKLLRIRLKNLEKQEKIFADKSDKLKEEIMGSLNKEEHITKE